MKKIKIIMAVLALTLFVTPAMAGTGAAKTAGGFLGAASIALFAGIGSLKKSDDTEFNTEEKEVLNAIQTLLAENSNGQLKAEDIASALEKFETKLNDESIKSIKDAITEQTKEINALKEKGEFNRKENMKSTIMKALKEQLDSPETLEKLRDLHGNKNKDFRLVIKAAEIMQVDAATNVYNQQLMPGIESAAREMERVSNYVNRVPSGDVNNPTIAYLEKYDEEGNAAITAEGIVKPLRSWKVRRSLAEPKKVAVRERMSDEFLLFIPALTQFLRQDIIDELADALDAHIVSEVNTGASTFVLTTISTTDPTYYDALRAAIAQVRSFKHNANTVFVNPVDACNMELTKGADGHYLYLSTMGADGQPTINRLRVIETTQVAVGGFIVGDMKKYNLRDVTNIIIKFVYSSDADGDDASQNLITVIGEQYVNTWLPAVHSTAFVEDTFANVIGAI